MASFHHNTRKVTTMEDNQHYFEVIQAEAEAQGCDTDPGTFWPVPGRELRNTDRGRANL